MFETSTCFNCGNTISTDKCPYCDYEFSIKFTCPKIINNTYICSISRKSCKFFNKNNFTECNEFKKYN